MGEASGGREPEMRTASLSRLGSPDDDRDGRCWHQRVGRLRGEPASLELPPSGWPRGERLQGPLSTWAALFLPG